MKTINPNLYPTGGYYFVEKDGTKITGTSWAAVVRNTKRYRENRGFPVGNIEAEVMAQASERNPHLSHDTTPGVKPRTKPPTLKTKVFEWLGQKTREAAQGPLDYVSDEEARRRAAICRKCPSQEAISHLCSVCTESRALLRERILAGRRQVAPDLEACNALNTDLRCAVHLAEAPCPDSALPGGCWRRSK